MSNNSEKALLPAGMSDVLPPDAGFETENLERLMAAFATHGYLRIKPPLIEFEESLLAGLGKAMTAQTFRLMDPVSQRMMGVRADMTPQVARIAATRMAGAPRPLRLSYAGEVLRVKGSQLRPDRQFAQVGAELIGAQEAAADVEVILLAALALANLGVAGFSVDLAMPTLVPAVCKSFGIDRVTEGKLRQALERKDADGVTQLTNDLGEKAAAVLSSMLAAAGPAERTLHVLEGLDLGAEAAHEWTTLKMVSEQLAAQARDLKVTIDPVENRGFEYHSGVTYTFFARDVRGEIGSGGRYMAENRTGGESATGFTLFMDTVLRALPAAELPERLYLPAGTADADGERLRAEGWVTVRGLSSCDDDVCEARRIGCGHLFEGGQVRAIGSEDEV